MSPTRALIAGAAAALLAPAAADAATLATAPCYIGGQTMSIQGSGWTAGSDWTVSSDGIFDSGLAAEDGTFTSTNANAPTLSNPSTFKPETHKLTGTENGSTVAETSFKVVNFLVKPRSLNGKPTGNTTWVFSGFLPGKKIFFHIKRKSHVWTQKAGKSKKPCGTLKKRMRRLPAVPANQIQYGRYKVFVDNRRKFKKGGLQYTATITIYKKFI